MERLESDSWLIASPTLRCPFFGHTVLLLVDHGEHGSFGLVLNRPLDLTVREVVSELSLMPSVDVRADVPVLVGGPVSSETGFVLFEHGGRAFPTATPVGDHLLLSSSTDVLCHAARGDLPGRALLFLGYAGWAPEQLEREFREGSWIRADVASDLVFDVPLEQRWELSMQRVGIDPALVTRTVASA